MRTRNVSDRPDAIAPELLNTAEDLPVTRVGVTSHQWTPDLSKVVEATRSPFRHHGGCFRTLVQPVLVLIISGEFTRMDAMVSARAIQLLEGRMRASA
ncbi:hypothetical protein [Kutzneria chonburiensis]|uniref:Uncharacterized protein n=1 Tax=Kutzneria chonburiensis TaxID=1483604 RepID=A0ABV6N9J3_9PSEU|nr:hypothetical protein [Kutzneria chonburiensis]